MLTQTRSRSRQPVLPAAFKDGEIMSDTPRTDAVWYKATPTFGSPAVVNADFARQLERELTRVTAERDALFVLADKFDDGIDWVCRALQAEAERDEALKNERRYEAVKTRSATMPNDRMREEFDLFRQSEEYPVDGWAKVLAWRVWQAAEKARAKRDAEICRALDLPFGVPFTPEEFAEAIEEDAGL